MMFQDNRAAGTYDIDIVFCIDVTGSMSPIIDEVKSRIREFPILLQKGMESIHKTLGNLRVKLIPFRDLNYDTDAISETGFFSLPEEIDQLQKVIDSLDPHGGGDNPESALDAIALAMKSQWCKTGWKKRHIIVVFTDASAIPLDEGIHLDGIPKNLSELEDWWLNGVPGGSLDTQSERLILFAPNEEVWNFMGSGYAVLFYPSQAGHGLKEFEMGKIASRIARSVVNPHYW